jgi:phosphoserine aminotransferase
VKQSKNSRHRIRTWLKRAQEKGVKIRILNSINDPEIVKEWYNSCYSYVYNGSPLFTFHQIYKYFNYLLNNGLLKLFIAEADGKINGLLSVLLDDYSDIAFFNPTAICEEGRKSGAGYLLLSNVINWLK